MGKDPLVSIILPVYNGEKYLKQSIESCLKQTYNNIELIIVNDCSTDKSLEIIEQYCENDSRVKLINNPTNKKLPASLNIGHRVARGEFATWTSDDNFYDFLAIETMVKTIRNKKVDVVYANYNLMENGVEKVVDLKDYGFLIFSNVIGACFLYRSKVYNKIEYDESLFLLEDYDFWLQCLTEFRFFHIQEVLYNYRIHESSLTESVKKDSKRKILFENNIRLVYSKFFYNLNLDEHYVDIFSRMHISPFLINEKSEIFSVRKYVSTCSNKLNLSKSVRSKMNIEVSKLQLKLLRSINNDLTIFDCIRFFITNALLIDFFQFKVWVKLCLNKK